MEPLKEAVKEGLRAANDAFLETGATLNGVLQAARDASGKAAEEHGTAVPVGFLECVLLKPVAKAYETSSPGKPQSFRQGLVIALSEEP